MRTTSLPVFMPNLANQRWSCHSCGNCCRSLTGHLTEAERGRLDEHDWAAELGAAPYVRLGRGYVLNKTHDDACVFLDENNLCRIHSKFGEDAKPLACRIFPFSVRPVDRGWQAALRFDCPSVITSKGRPLREHHGAVAAMVEELTHDGRAEADTATLERGVIASRGETEILLHRLDRWIREDRELTFTDRAVGAAFLTMTLNRAKFGKVREERFTDLLDILIETLPAESIEERGEPSAAQDAMVRQAAFAHTEHVTLSMMLAGGWRKFRKRWEQLTTARRFRASVGVAPPIRGLPVQAPPGFASIEAVTGAGSDRDSIAELLVRYASARLASRSVFGGGYYGWPVFHGLGALCLSLAVVGWLARYSAAGHGRSCVSFDDAAAALTLVDRAVTRLPSLGTQAERLRVSYLFKDEGLCRIVRRWSPV